MKKKLIRHSAAEDAAITKAAMVDPDNLPLTDQEWEKVRPTLIRGRGRPLGSGTKELIKNFWISINPKVKVGKRLLIRFWVKLKKKLNPYRQ